MKKTLLTTAVALALGVSTIAQAADTDTLNAPAGLTTTAIGGASTGGEGSAAENKPVNSYNANANGSGNSNMTSGFNDVNSHNWNIISEDGVVGYGQNIQQAVASSDLEHTIGAAAGLTIPSSAGASIAGGANFLSDNSVSGPLAQAAGFNTHAFGSDLVKSNVINNGSFNNHGGVLSAAQNTGNLYEVGQSVVVQSNGGI